MKTWILSLAAIGLAGSAAAEMSLPVRETGHGETASTFLNLCVKPEAQDFETHIKLVRKSGWTVFYEDGVGVADVAYEASASSNPGDECSLHLTLEQDQSGARRCEVVVSRFCSASRTSTIRASIMSELADTQTFAFDPVSTADENRRSAEHEHHVYRNTQEAGSSVRLADTGGSLFLSATHLAHNK